MSWNQCLYAYHQKVGGQFLAGEEDDGELILTYREQPLSIRLDTVAAGRGTVHNVRARTAVRLERPYTLRIGGKSTVSTGVNAVLGVLDLGLEKLPKGLDLREDYGYPEFTRDRIVRTNDRPFTKRVLSDMALRKAMDASPQDKLAVMPGPGPDGLHLVEVTAQDPNLAGSGWPLCGYDLDDMSVEWKEFYSRAQAEFFPRIERLLALVKTARDGVAAWRM